MAKVDDAQLLQQTAPGDLAPEELWRGPMERLSFLMDTITSSFLVPY